jgi:3-oxoacyl-(acyl-carrier-protein) synthase
MGAGNGGVELISSLLAIREGFIPPIIHCDEPVPGLGLNLVRGAAIPAQGNTFLNLNITRYGQSSCVITRAS